MTIPMRRCLNSVLIVLVLLLGIPSASGSDVPTVEELKPGFDLEKYEFSYPLAEMRFAAKTFKMCWWGCHEAAEVNQPGTILPRIEGQDVDYFLKQFNAFDGDRKGSIASQMKMMMHSYTPDQVHAMAEVAQVFKLPYEPGEKVRNSEMYAKGKETYGTYCAMCHGPGGDSKNPKYPVLRGQTSGYIFEQMINFRDQKRTNHNSAQMTPFARILSEEDYRNLATYLSGTEWFEREENPQFITGLGMPPVEGFRLPDTGYVFDTTPVFGEDADYTRNPLSYTISKSGKVTLDDNTRLMWERDSRKDWISAFKAVQHCEDLVLDGYDDWRLPLMKELITIADYGNYRPAIDMDAFLNMPSSSSGIWAFPVMADHKEHAWHVGFPDGHIMGQHIYSEKMVRCVRADGGAAFHANAFTSNGDGTVTDDVTGLMWQQQIDYELRPWLGAIEYCEDLELAGHDDWHLPNVKEGVSIIDYNRFEPTIDETFFPNTPSDRFFWLSTSDALKKAQEQPDIFFNPFPPESPPRKDVRIAANDIVDHSNNIGWAMEFIIGSAWRYTKNREFYTRCTRYAN
jgi:cytochrome c553